MGKVKATYFSILAWRIQARIYSPWGCKESGTAERLSLSNLIKLRVPVMRKDEFIQRNECLLLLTKCLIIFFIILYILAVGFSLLGRLTDSSAGKESCNAGDPGSVPGSGRSTGEGIGYPLQYSWATLVAQLVKNPSAMRETWV